jgi:hypothetical protein
MAKVKVIDEEVIKHLKLRYKSRGNMDFFFRVKGIKLPYGNHQIGRSCAKLTKGEKPLLKRVNGINSPSVYKTRFGDLFGKN